MAQTTSAISARDATLEISTNGSSWTDISGFSNTIEPDGGEMMTAAKYTFNGNTPIITRGKRGPLNLKCSVVYTEGVSDPFATIAAAYEAGTNLYARYTIRGIGSGNYLFTTSAGTVKTVVYPKADAESADAVVIEFTLEVGSITRTTQ